MRALFRSLCLAAAAMALTAAAPDTFTREELDALEAEKAAAEAQLATLQNAGNDTETDLGNLDNLLISAAMESRRREEQAADAERELIDLRTRQSATRTQLLEDEAALEDLLAALAASNRRRPPSLIVSPSQANMAVRRAILMSNTTPRLAERADGLKDEIDELNALERRIRGERARLGAAEATLALKKAEIEHLAAVKRSKYEDLSGDIDVLRARSETLGQQAKTLRGLLTALEETAPSLPGMKPTARPKLAALKKTGTQRVKPRASTPAPTNLKPLGSAMLGGLTQPAAGMVSRSFGDKIPTGGKSEGVTIETRAEAQIVAPVDGRVEFAKAFRSYGPMLILRTSDEYHVILSGMSRIYVTEDQSVAAGEPVGRMTDLGDPPPELYMELRHGDEVMNPANWMKRGK